MPLWELGCLGRAGCGTAGVLVPAVAGDGLCPKDLFWKQEAKSCMAGLGRSFPVRPDLQNLEEVLPQTG